MLQSQSSRRSRVENLLYKLTPLPSLLSCVTFCPFALSSSFSFECSRWAGKALARGLSSVSRLGLCFSWPISLFTETAAFWSSLLIIIGRTTICAASEARTWVSLATSVSKPRKASVPVSSDTESITGTCRKGKYFWFLLTNTQKEKNKNYSPEFSQH